MASDICENDLVLDFGCCPGGWSAVALQQGARVIGIDRSPPDTAIRTNRRHTFLKDDAFAVQLEQLSLANVDDTIVDWFLWDIICFPHQLMDVLAYWIGGRRCRNFVVTIKFRGTDQVEQLTPLKKYLYSISNIIDWQVNNI
jgi:23S rRNA (cytidine2498-2'-O)-methyltransferase